MIKRGLNKGFTVVELLIVIICVAILATLVSLSYGNVQIQSRDIKIRDAANKFSDAIKLIHLRQNSFLLGGRVSSGPASSTTGCPSGANGFQAPAITGVQCTIGDAAVAMGYGPAALFTDLPPNTEHGGTGK